MAVRYFIVLHGRVGHRGQNYSSQIVTSAETAHGNQTGVDQQTRRLSAFRHFTFAIGQLSLAVQAAFAK
jgi:hypothetical protein